MYPAAQEYHSSIRENHPRESSERIPGRYKYSELGVVSLLFLILPTPPNVNVGNGAGGFEPARRTDDLSAIRLTESKE